MTSDKKITLPFTPELISSFRCSKSLKNNKPHTEVTSLDFDDTGYYLITSGEDETIQLYDSRSGKHKKTIFSKKYGAHLARFTHHSMNCVYASTKEDDTIRYLSLHDNSFIRYFKGHKGRVNCMEVSPVDDALLSSSYDHSVRLWDLRSASCQGLLNIPAPSLVSFDPAGLVFAVANSQLSDVSLYDIRAYNKMPFLSFRPGLSSATTPWSKLEFSNNGKYIMVCGTGAEHSISDAFSGNPIVNLVGHLPHRSRKNMPTSNATFSVDAKYVFGACADKTVCVWDLNNIGSTSKLTLAYSLPSVEPVSLVAMSPRTMLLASADKDLQLWLPQTPL